MVPRSNTKKRHVRIPYRLAAICLATVVFPSSGCATARATATSEVVSSQSAVSADEFEALRKENKLLRARVNDLEFALDTLRLAITRIRERVEVVELNAAGGAVPHVNLPTAPPPKTPQVSGSAVNDDILASLGGLSEPEIEMPAGYDVDNRDIEVARAKGAIEDGHCDEGMQTLGGFIRSAPEDPRIPEVLLLIGRCYSADDEHELAEIYYRRIADNYPFHERAPQALAALAKSELALGNNSEAQRLERRLLSEYPDSEPARVLRAQAQKK